MDKGVSDHPIFTTDPAEHVQYVHKQVRVDTKDGQEHIGWVYTVDPVSQCVVLATLTDNGDTIKSLTMLMGHAVKNITVLDADTKKHKEQLDKLFYCDLTNHMAPEEVSTRQQNLRSWLLKNRLPVTIKDSDPDVLNVADVLKIHPPYGPDNCISTNEIILGRIQGLIKNIPKDQDSW